MNYTTLIQKFLSFVQVIKKLNPSYKQPGDGSNGVCDCIGLVIGAIRRMGLKWNGIHGSNYAARYQIVGLSKITALSQIQLGDVMLKAYEKGHSKWTLNKYPRYLPGGSMYTGDLKDYYHAGVVTNLNPIQITHMTSPKMKVFTVNSMRDLTSSNWLYHGKAKPIVNAATDKDHIPEHTPDKTPTSGSQAVVVAESGGTVNMRAGANTNTRILMRVPLGVTVDILNPGENWAHVKYGNMTGYMMAKFLDIIGDGKCKY